MLFIIRDVKEMMFQYKYKYVYIISLGKIKLIWISIKERSGVVVRGLDSLIQIHLP